MNNIEYRLNVLANQLDALQKQLVSIQQILIRNQNTRSGGVRVQPVIVGVKDITSAQLFHAYKKGLNMEQLCQLADGKYTADQIYKKLQKLGVQ